MDKSKTHFMLFKCIVYSLNTSLMYFVYFMKTTVSPLIVITVLKC